MSKSGRDSGWRRGRPHPTLRDCNVHVALAWRRNRLTARTRTWSVILALDCCDRRVLLGFLSLLAAGVSVLECGVTTFLLCCAQWDGNRGHVDVRGGRSRAVSVWVARVLPHYHLHITHLTDGPGRQTGLVAKSKGAPKQNVHGAHSRSGATDLGRSAFWLHDRPRTRPHASCIC